MQRRTRTTIYYVRCAIALALFLPAAALWWLAVLAAPSDD